MKSLSVNGPRPPASGRPSKLNNLKSPRFDPRRASQAGVAKPPATNPNKPPADEGISKNDAGALRYSQALKTGEHTVLLLCTDNDDSLLPSAGNQDQSDPALSSLLSLDFNISMPDEATASVQSPTEEAAPPPSVVTSSPPPTLLQRRMTRADQFLAVEKSLPGVTLDQQQRKSVTHAMLDLNIWHEDDLSEDEEQTSPRIPRNSRASRTKGSSISPGKPSPARNGKDTQIQAAEPVHSPPRRGRRSSTSGKNFGTDRKSTVVGKTPTGVSTSFANIKEEAELVINESDSEAVTDAVAESGEHEGSRISPSVGLGSRLKSLVTPILHQLGGKSQSNPLPTLSSANTISSTSGDTPIVSVANENGSNSIAPAGGRQKVTMIRPKQIVPSPKLQQMEERRNQEREFIRDQVVQKAVNFLVQLNIQQSDAATAAAAAAALNTSSVLSTGSSSTTAAAAPKSQKEIKQSAVKRVTGGLVDRALKKAKANFFVLVDNHHIKEAKWARRRAQAAKFLSQVWRRHCGRTDVYRILEMGRAGLEEKKTAEMRENYEYRLRVAQRRIEEEFLHRHWKKLQSRNPTFPVTKALEERERGPVTINSEGIAMSKADEELLADDFKHTRPDLAPFSTKINNIISGTLREIKQSLERRDEMERNLIHLAQNSPRQTPVGLLSRMASTVGASSPTHMLSREASLRAHSPPLERNPSQRGKKMSSTERARHDASNLTTTTVPPRSPQRVQPRPISLIGWEEMARLDTIPAVETLRQEKRFKSPAYKVLEKLCGLTEEDIEQQKIERLREGKGKVSLHGGPFAFM